jgi:hypothetical protein
MAMISGVVEEVAIKEVSTKFGLKPTYSFKIDGKWVKTGFKNPNLEAGYTVDFDAQAGTYGLETKAVNIISRTISPAVLARAAPGSMGSAAVPGPATRSSGSWNAREKVFPIPALHGDRSIVRQNALARATDLYIAARGGKPFELDESSTELVIALARRFEAYTAGDLDMAEAIKEELLEVQNQAVNETAIS